MRKRKNSSSESEEGSEMEIEGEAKMGDQEIKSDDDDDSDDDLEGEEEEVQEEESEAAERSVTMVAAVDNPFMDSFYALSSANPIERARAAQTLIEHSLVGSSANAKDAAYALRRLLNGLCSGRAAARQGNASALASFLKIAVQLGKIQEIHSQAVDKSDHSMSSDLMFIRERLLSATDPSQIVGRKKGSEERDYQFGRLFGILALVRSRVLVAATVDSNDANEVSTALTLDLVELFWEKKWMREPAAHGITTMLKLFLDGNDENHIVARSLVRDVVAPKLLSVTQEKEETLERQKLLEGYCAEQIGVAAYIQSNLTKLSEKWAFPLDDAVVSTTTVPWIAHALSETSSVVYPRTHFVWDALWCLLTKEQDETKRDSKGASTRVLRDSAPLSAELGSAVLNSIVQGVIKEKLLRMDEDSSPKKVTHERRSLALCIVKCLSGVPFQCSLIGLVQIDLDGECIESILLTPDIIRALFVNVITGGRQKQNASLLKPMALDILAGMADAAVNSGGSRQLSYAKAFLNCDARFDVHTKTSTLADILGFSSENDPSREDFSRWNGYLDYLEANFLSSCENNSDGEGDSRAIGFGEVIYSTAKSILRLESNDGEILNSTVTDEKEKIVRRILDFFMVASFFDSSEVSHTKKKGKKNAGLHIIATALRMKEHMKANGVIPFAVRSVVAARFFSLTSEFAMVVAREPKDKDAAKAEKDTNVLALLLDLCDAWRVLEANGAKRFETPKSTDSDADDDDDDEHQGPEEVIAALRKSIGEFEKNEEFDEDNSLQQAKKRCCTGIAVLSLTLYLHRLHCGIDGSTDEDPDADGDADEDEICNALGGLKSVADDFLATDEQDSNPLLGLAELCANVLSSPIGSGSIGRGCSPKLVREAVRYAWLGGLRLASCQATEEKSLLDSSVIDVLMEAVGADSSMENDENDASEFMNEKNESDEESDEESGNVYSSDEGIFGKAANIMDDDEKMEGDTPDDDPSDEAEPEMEIDHSKLQTMLEEDSDADINETELEHHEGADAALAKLIRLRQDARKAGQQAREKIEISNQLRCTILLEILLGRPDAWNRLFRSTLLEMVMPLLLHRQQVAVMLQKAVDGGSKIGTGEKRALLERLTSIIKQKLCKLRLSSMPLANNVKIESGRELAKAILREARKAKDKDQTSCCSTCLVFVLRAMPSTHDTVDIVSSECGQVVHDWSTKRSSGASLLEDLINQMPSLAQATLVEPLTKATLESRSPFLKLEAFRLLSLLFSTKEITSAAEMQEYAKAGIENSMQDLLSAILTSLNDGEMSKPKRARIIFKTLEKILPLLSDATAQKSSSYLQSLKMVVNTLGDKGSGGKGNNLHAAISKLSALIDDTLSKEKEEDTTTMEGVEPKQKSSETKTKKSKKKKKKKR